MKTPDTLDDLTNEWRKWEFGRGFDDAFCKRSPAPNFFLKETQVRNYLRGYATCKGVERGEYNNTGLNFLDDFTAGLFDAFAGNDPKLFNSGYDAGYQTALDAKFGQFQD